MARDPDPADFDDPDRLRALMANAKRLEKPELAVACQARIAALAGQEYDDEVERAFWEAVTMAEEIKTEVNGKTTRLSRTRQKHTRDGALKCIEDLALKEPASDGFDILASKSRLDLSFEAIVVRFPDRFSDEAGEAAHRKLAGAEFDVSPLIEGAAAS